MKFYVLFLRQRSKHNIFARCIQLVMRNDANHVEVLVVPDEMTLKESFGSCLSYGAVFPKSRMASYRNLLDHYFVERMLPVKINVSEEKAVMILNCLCGKNYSPAQIFVICLKLIFGRLISFLPYVKLNLTKYLICTELVGIFLQEACGHRFEQSPELLTINEVESIILENLEHE